MRGLSALRGEDPAGGVKAGDVVGAGERAHEDHRIAFARAAHGLVGVEDDRALGRSRRGRHAAREHLIGLVRVEDRMKQGFEAPASIVIRASASRQQPLLAASRAKRTAARAGRLAARVWRMNSRPSSTVNSTSCMSR